jgi:hypothetical protein
MSSYNFGEEQLGGAYNWQSDKGKLINLLHGTHPEKSANAWGSFFNTLFPLYQTGVKNGTYPVFKPFSTAGSSTIRALAAASGFSATDVSNFMTTLASAAQQSQISMVVLNPGVPGAMKESLLTEAAQTAENVARDASQLVGNVAKDLTAGLWPIIIGVVAVAAVIYSPALKGATGAIGRAGGRLKSAGSRVMAAGSRLKQKFAR